MNVLQMFIHLILLTALRGRNHYSLHFTDGNTEAREARFACGHPARGRTSFKLECLFWEPAWPRWPPDLPTCCLPHSQVAPYPAGFEGLALGEVRRNGEEDLNFIKRIFILRDRWRLGP
jgi:hypothetical protein